MLPIWRSRILFLSTLEKTLFSYPRLILNESLIG
jgi:hypothetical protein